MHLVFKTPAPVARLLPFATETNFPPGGWICAGIAGGFLGGITLLMLILDLRRAPEAYEDEDGFHVVPSSKRTKSRR